jgi:hypothetical protein
MKYDNAMFARVPFFGLNLMSVNTFKPMIHRRTTMHRRRRRNPSLNVFLDL